MINLMEMFGDKYKVEFDRERYLYDRKKDKDGTGKVSTDEAWYYKILCKYGNIEIACKNDLLAFYCNSGRIAKQIEAEMGRELNLCHIGDIDAIFFFKIEQTERILKFAKPGKKKQMTEEQKEKVVSNLREYRKKKSEKTVQKLSEDDSWGNDIREAV